MNYSLFYMRIILVVVLEKLDHFFIFFAYTKLLLISQQILTIYRPLLDEI